MSSSSRRDTDSRTTCSSSRAKPWAWWRPSPRGYSLTGVELQATKYSSGLPAGLNPPLNPLPFLYVSTGVETRFINLLDPEPRSRAVSMTTAHIHRPATLAEWLRAEPKVPWPAEAPEVGGALRKAHPSTLRSRILALPPVEPGRLYPNHVEAVEKLEHSLEQNRPRSLVQMATGSGKTIFAITAIYRLVKHAEARRVLFLVDRKNLGEQAEKEFQAYRTAAAGASAKPSSSGPSRGSSWSRTRTTSRRLCCWSASGRPARRGCPERATCW